MTTTLVFLPKESRGQGSLGDYSPWGRKIGMHAQLALTLIMEMGSEIPPGFCFPTERPKKAKFSILLTSHSPYVLVVVGMHGFRPC